MPEALTPAEARALLELELPPTRLDDPLLGAVVKLTAWAEESLAGAPAGPAEPSDPPVRFNPGGPVPSRGSARRSPEVASGVVRAGSNSAAVLGFMTAQRGAWTAEGIVGHDAFEAPDMSLRQVQSVLAALTRRGLIEHAVERGAYQVAGSRPAAPTPPAPAPGSPVPVGESDPIARTRVDPDAARRRAAGAMFGEGLRGHDLRGARG